MLTAEAFSRLTGDKKYTDKMIITLADTGGKCMHPCYQFIIVQACRGTFRCISCPPLSLTLPATALRRQFVPRIMGCSESQVFSFIDFSTNSCNIRNLLGVVMSMMSQVRKPNFDAFLVVFPAEGTYTAAQRRMVVRLCAFAGI